MRESIHVCAKQTVSRSAVSCGILRSRSVAHVPCRAVGDRGWRGVRWRAGVPACRACARAHGAGRAVGRVASRLVMAFT